MIAGPYCTRLLADCGAEVIKVEPTTGDPMRRMAPLRSGHSSYFAHLNSGKKSVTLDLKHPADHDKAIALIDASDVVVENFRPGVMQSLGLGYTTLAARNNKLVYCSISGFGQSGPQSRAPAYAPIVHAASGFDLVQLQYQDELTRPEKSGVFVADILAGTYAFGAVQTGLLGSLRHGSSQFIDLALFDSMINLLVYECQQEQFAQDQPRLLYTPTRTTDGFVIVTPITQKNFEAMAHAMGHPDWITDPAFAQLEVRRNNWGHLTGLIEHWTSQRSARQCEELMLAAGVPCSRYQTLAQAMDSDQSRHRGLMASVHDAAGALRVPNPPFQFSDGSVRVGASAPALGEHTDAVLAAMACRQ